MIEEYLTPLVVLVVSPKREFSDGLVSQKVPCSGFMRKVYFEEGSCTDR